MKEHKGWMNLIFVFLAVNLAQHRSRKHTAAVTVCLTGSKDTTGISRTYRRGTKNSGVLNNSLHQLL